jgi:hypothetical protein
LVRLTATGNGRDEEWLRVTQQGFYADEAGEWDGVARLGVDLAGLQELLGCGQEGSGSAGPDGGWPF